MIALGSIPIRNRVHVNAARTKVLEVVQQVTGDQVRATRLATGTSELCRQLLHHVEDGSIDLLLETRGPVLELSIRVTPDLPGRSGAAAFFDRLVARGGQLYARADLGPFSMPDGHDIERLRRIVQRKSRDTLLADLQEKNRELQESLDDLRRTRSAKERMESELSIGRDIQMAMLPLDFPAFPDRGEFDVYATLRPAREVGGDFYDFFLLDDDTLAICVGDVSGKGVPAALFMAVTRTLIKSRASHDRSPAGILTHTNNELAEGNDSAMFVTLFLAIIDLRTGTARFCNAGHNPPYVLRAAGALERVADRHGPVAGAVEEMEYSESGLALAPGDVWLLYTDGVTEAMDTGSQLYGDGRLEATLERLRGARAEDLVRLLAEDVRAFEGEADQADDVTVLALRYEGP